MGLIGCSSTSVQLVALAPKPNTCQKASMHDAYSIAVTVVCYDKQGDIVAVQPGEGIAPLQILTSATNTAVLTTAIPIVATQVVK